VEATQTYLAIRLADPILLPVPVEVPDRPVRTSRRTSEALSVAWVGRLYDFKINILVHTLRRFRAHAIASGRQIVFHVVGGGPREAALQEFDEPSAGFRIVRHGDMSAADLQRLLRDHVDVVTAMGTAALEGAALGLPVMLLDLSCGEVPAGYQFRWLHQAHGFELGHTITSADCSETGDSFPRMMAELETDYAHAATRDFDYVRRYHALPVVAARFLALAADARLRFGDIPRRVWRKSILRRVYERLRY
jgi:hypothetical protein